MYDIVGEKSSKIFSKQEVAAYDGNDQSPGLYLGIMGRVYDVSKGPQYYGPGGGYAFFSGKFVFLKILHTERSIGRIQMYSIVLGKDGTRAYVTGKFDEEGLIDDVSGFEDNQMMEIENWIKFYDETYVFKGVFILSS